MCYYSDQLKKIGLESKFAPKMKVIGGEIGQTNFFDINDESAPILVEWLKKNFIENFPPLEMIKQKGKLVTDYEAQDFDDTEPYLVEMYAYKGYMYTTTETEIVRRSKTAKST